MTARMICTLIAGAAVLGALAGCSGASSAGVDPAAAGQHSGHGSGTHTMPDGTSMPEDRTRDMGHGGHGGDGLAHWATQKSGGTILITDGEGRPFHRSDRAGPSRPASAGAPRSGNR